MRGKNERAKRTRDTPYSLGGSRWLDLFTSSCGRPDDPAHSAVATVRTSRLLLVDVPPRNDTKAGSFTSVSLALPLYLSQSTR